jgi:hypothetical protein
MQRCCRHSGQGQCSACSQISLVQTHTKFHPLHRDPRLQRHRAVRFIADSAVNCCGIPSSLSDATSQRPSQQSSSALLCCEWMLYVLVECAV